MATFRIAHHIRQNEYDAFRLLIKDDLEFPTAYSEWLKRTAEELKKRGTQGEVRQVTIHPQEFANWCKHSGLNPRYEYLDAFAVTKGHGKG
jgi:hypothetical protein